MRAKVLANIPTAFVAGLGGRFGERAFDLWIYTRGIRLSQGVVLASFAAFVVAPFLLFVIGVDPKRWAQDYDHFGAEAKADHRRVWIRWVASLCWRDRAHTG